jgi:hypothetical protein
MSVRVTPRMPGGVSLYRPVGCPRVYGAFDEDLSWPLSRTVIRRQPGTVLSIGIISCRASEMLRRRPQLGIASD